VIKILVKAFILVCIVLSIYFIVNPSACSNLINGRVVNSMDETFTQPDRVVPQQELLGPSGDKPEVTQTQEESDVQPAQDSSFVQPSTTGEETAAPVTSGYSQEEVDAAIASRYVELEREYAKKNLDGKDMAKEISYTVMDDFDLTPSEWEAFLQRATATNLFDKVRQEYDQMEAEK